MLLCRSRLMSIAKAHGRDVAFSVDWSEPIIEYLNNSHVVISLLDDPGADNCEMLLLPDGWYHNGCTNEVLFEKRIFAICVFVEILLILNPQSCSFWLHLYLILLPVVVFVLSNLIYMERGMFMLRTKMHVDESGIVCTYKHRTIWTCCWNEIEAFQYYSRFLHKCRRIVLFNKNKTSLYFEISKAAQEAISQYCPKTELLENL